MTRKTAISATFTEKLAIKTLLDERLHPVDGTVPELFRYEEGWNDERVAHHINPLLGSNHTAKIRCECFGKLYGKQPTKRVKYEERLTVLEGQFQRALLCMKLTPEEWVFIHSNAEDNE